MIPFSFLATQGGGGGFTPNDLTSILCWLDASDAGSVTLNTGNVAQINDQTSNGNDATQVSAGDQPVYAISAQNGLNAMHLDTDTKVLDLPNGFLGSPAKFSMGWIFKLDGTVGSGGSRTIFYALDNPITKESKVAFADTTNNASIDFNNIAGRPTVISTSNPSAGTWYRLLIVWDSTQADPNKMKMYLNNVDVTNDLQDGSGVFDAPFTLQLGRPGFSLIGYVAEAVYGTDAWDMTERNNLDTYWTTKWAI